MKDKEERAYHKGFYEGTTLMETTNLTTKFIRIKLFRRWAIYLHPPITVKHLAPKLGGINRHKQNKWAEDQRKEFGDYMRQDWKRRKGQSD